MSLSSKAGVSDTLTIHKHYTRCPRCPTPRLAPLTHLVTQGDVVAEDGVHLRVECIFTSPETTYVLLQHCPPTNSTPEVRTAAQLAKCSRICEHCGRPVNESHRAT